MSADNNSAKEAADVMCCANCGKAEIDDVKLKYCDKCDLARYCGDDCQQDHREKHKAICNERAVKLRDEILFKQPQSTYLGDCPICFLPLPLAIKQRMTQTCCSKIICNGCLYATRLREFEGRLEFRCPFCRKPLPNNKEADRNHAKRAELNDPIALGQMGKMYYNEGNYDSAFEYWTRAAELGDAEAHYNLSEMYFRRAGVKMDEKMATYHMEEAAIGGHPMARLRLGVYERVIKRRNDRGVKHLIIAANLGYSDSIKLLKECYKEGDVSKTTSPRLFGGIKLLLMQPKVHNGR